MQLGSTEAIKEAVAAGLGIAAVSRVALGDELALGKLKVLEMDGLRIRRSFTRLSLSGRPPTPAARAFLRLLDVAGG